MKKPKETGNDEVISVRLSPDETQVLDGLHGRETDRHWGWKIIGVTYSESDGYLLWAKRPEVA